MTDHDPEQSPPAGTVYGGRHNGALKPRTGESNGLHPAVIVLVFSAGIVILLSLGYWALRIPSDDSALAALPTAQPATPEPTTPEPSPSPSPSPTPDKLGIGSWLISPADDPKTRLRADGDFAAMTSDDPTVLTVVAGLADNSCFSFRDKDGRFLRHFDFRLRFAPSEDSPLFRDDATFCPAAAQSAAAQAAGAVRLSSKNYPDRLLHRRGTELYIDKPDGSDNFVAESTFAVHAPPN